MKCRIIWRVGKVITLLLAALLLSACAQKGRAPQGMLDTPLHHYETGMRLFNTALSKSGQTELSLTGGGRLQGALDAFEQALSLEPEYGPALAGKGLVLVEQGDMENGLALIEDGQDEADNKSGSPEVLWTQVAEIRAYIALHGQLKVAAEELADVAESACKRALKSLPKGHADGAMAWYWLGEAQIQALYFDEAASSLREARKLGGGFAEKAAARLHLLEQIREAALLTSVGKRIALVDAISRADMAALLVEELGVEKFFESTAPLQEGRFMPPADAEQSVPEVSDLGTGMNRHPLAEDVFTVLRYELRGLEPFADGTFQPERPLTRAEASLIAEDIYIRAKNDAAMATRYVGTKSPFADVRGDHPYFNAVMFATARGFFHADVAKGRFRPFDTVSGVEAVLLINALRTQLDVL